MQKVKFSKFNDGVVRIYREKKRNTDFNAKQNVSDLGDLDFIVKLDYEQSTKREQDLEFAEQHSFSLSAKIRTRFVNGVDSKCKAVIGSELYDVSYVDKTRTEMWLFLEFIRKIGDTV